MNSVSYPAPRPFAFEDLPLDDKGRRLEPDSWGPAYPNLGAAVEKWRKADRARDLNDCDKRAYGASVGAAIRALQRRELIGAGRVAIDVGPGEFNPAKYRGMLSAKFHAAAARDRTAYATGKEPGLSGLKIGEAYKAAMAEKRQREAAERNRPIVQAWDEAKLEAAGWIVVGTVNGKPKLARRVAEAA